VAFGPYARCDATHPLASTGVASALLVGALAVALAVLVDDSGGPAPQRGGSHTVALVNGRVPLWPVPAQVVRACHDAQAHASFVVLCPSRLPRATEELVPWEPPFALEAAGQPEALDFSYSAPEAGLGTARTLALNGPERFLHFVVGLATQGVPPGARPARLGGRSGMLAPATAVDSYQGAYFANHVRFVWRERGVRYVATLHTFGERGTTSLLDRIIAGLVPANKLPAVEQPPESALVGPAPTGVAADANGVWVATVGALSTGLNGQLLHLDRVSLHPTAQPTVRPKGIRLAIGESSVWTVSYDVTPDGQHLTPPELARVNPTTARVTARLGLGPGEGAGVAVGAGSVWISIDGLYPWASGAVLRIDPVTMQVRTRTPVGRGAASLALDGSSIWVANSISNTVSRLTSSSGLHTAATVPVGHHPYGVAVGSRSVWVTNVADGTVSRIDPRSNRVTATIPVGRAPYGVTTERHGVSVAVLGSGTLVRIDPNTNRVTGRLALRGDPLAIATDGRLLYVTINTDGLLLRIDPATVSR
jgi:YVTN family beta-propeller protein